MPDPEKKSILKGVRETLGNGIPKDGKDFNGVRLFKTSYDCMHGNWSKGPSRSEENWQLRRVPLPKDSVKKNGHKTGAEVPLERAIAKAFDGMDRLWNQMPVASGLLSVPTAPEVRNDEGRRAVDLVYKPRISEEKYEFLELKVLRGGGSRNSLRDAALEVIEYGLIYLFSRKHKDALGYKGDRYRVLSASHIGLRVLAPQEYFERANTGDFPIDRINSDLCEFIKCEGFSDLMMDIGFDVFPKGFDPNVSTNNPEVLRLAIINKQAFVYIGSRNKKLIDGPE
jgi:hypothetical protein